MELIKEKEQVSIDFTTSQTTELKKMIDDLASQSCTLYSPQYTLLHAMLLGYVADIYQHRVDK